MGRADRAGSRWRDPSPSRSRPCRCSSLPLHGRTKTSRSLRPRLRRRQLSAISQGDPAGSIRGGTSPDDASSTRSPSSARPGPLRIWATPESHCFATRTCWGITIREFNDIAARRALFRIGSMGHSGLDTGHLRGSVAVCCCPRAAIALALASLAATGQF